MKYNPKINDSLAACTGFTDIHPGQDLGDCQGALKLLYDLQLALERITGMARFTLQPASGAHGEFCGLLAIRNYHRDHNPGKDTVIVPDSAHGTNPATAMMTGYKVITCPSGPDGLVDMLKLVKLVDSSTAAIMLTNPNTLGLFEKNILNIAELAHRFGAFLYYDGANFNALLGVATPALMGFDVVHLNLHKTFSTPHGSGGPGAGAVGVSSQLAEYLPGSVVEKTPGKEFYVFPAGKNKNGSMRAFYGNFPVLVRAYAYILRLGRAGFVRVAENAVLNANYIKEKLKNYYPPAYPAPCAHEVVFSGLARKESYDITALHIAKRLIDFAIHPPTMYFPLIVKEALMVEPTETESKETLDRFIKIMIAIAGEAETSPQVLKDAPQSTCLCHLDEVKAARNPDLRWTSRT